MQATIKRGVCILDVQLCTLCLNFLHYPNTVFFTPSVVIEPPWLDQAGSLMVTLT